MLWSGKTTGGTIELSEPIWNWRLVGVVVSTRWTDDRDVLALCSVMEGFHILTASVGTLSGTDARDIYVRLEIASNTTLSPVMVMMVTRRLNSFDVQSVESGRAVYGVIGLIRR